MLSSITIRERQNLIGRRACVEGNKYGIIKFYGKTSFAEGVWCGIELDEAVGDNDGTINNICYFTCKEKYGIFVPASEASIMNSPASNTYLDVLDSVQSMSLIDKSSNVNIITENLFSELSVFNDTQPVLPEVPSSKTALNESYTITKEYCKEKKLSVINEENSKYDFCWDKVPHTSFTGSAILSKCEDMFFTNQDLKLISITSENHEVKDEDEKNYDSDESLGILPDVLDKDFTGDNLILDDGECNRDLNITMNLSNELIEEFSYCQNRVFNPSDEELIFSPIRNKLNISCAETDKNPVCYYENTPKYASTPKQENNSYVIDAEIASAQDIANKSLLNKKMSESYEVEKDLEFNLNKTIVIETEVDFMRTNILASSFSESDKNMNQQQNILNNTCNMTKPFDTVELNKTFGSLNVLLDKCILPTIIQDQRSEQCEEAEFNSDLCKENVLNLTCDLVKEIDTNFPQTELACMVFSDNLKGSATNFLNTTISYPHELAKTEQVCYVIENKSDVKNDEYSGKEDMLNITCENIDKAYRLHTNSETLKCITNFEESNKPLQLGTKNNSMKRKFLSFPKKDIALKKSDMKNESTALDREKNVRKSISSFGKTVRRAEPNRLMRRSSFACSSNTLSQVHETKIISHSSAKSLFPTCSVEDGKSKCSLTNKEKIAGTNFCQLQNQAIKSLPSKSCGTKLEKTKFVCKIKLKGSQESLLNETINLPPPISDASKTVIKKPRNSMKINCSRRSSLDPHEEPLDRSFKSASQESLLNKTINLPPPISGASKTVTKKPRNSMKINYSVKTSLVPHEEPLSKNIKSAIPSFQRNKSVKISKTRHKEITQKFDENRTSASSSETGLKKPVNMEDKLKISSRLPQRTLSQKTISSDFHSSNTKPYSNITRPQSSISVFKLPSAKTSSQPSASSASLNQRNELAGKVARNDKILMSAQQSCREQSTRIPKHFSSSSKIPSMSQFSRQQEKSSQGISRRTESSTRKFQSDLK